MNGAIQRNQAPPRHKVVDKHRSMFVRFRSRLALYRRWRGNSQGWEDRWSRQSANERIKKHSKGQLGEFERLFVRHLPRDLPILEAGCGLGQFVMALASRGYRVEGIDYATDTVERIRTVAPNLNVRVGEISSVDTADGTYGGYISLGVLEHNPDGPLAGLKEARRILHSKGVAFISMPYLNPRRRKLLKKVQSCEDIELANGLRFYQYYFSRNDFKNTLHQAGFEVIDEFPYAVYAGLTRDFVVGRWLSSHKFFSFRIHRQIAHRCILAPNWARRRFGHMLMFVCKPAI